MMVFYLIFSLLSMIALVVVIYPFRRTLWGVIILIPIILGGLVFAYAQWGGWESWSKYVQNNAKQQQIRVLLQSEHGIDLLIQQMKARLNQTPKSARGWYLLGRLYASQNKWQQAHDAYLKAYRLNPENPQIMLNYKQSLKQLKLRQI